MNKPKTLLDLFEFYYQECKPLYGQLSADNTLPVELLFEINAAFDHLSRHWKYQESEEQVVRTSAAHLKRSLFDGYKLILKQTRDQYEELISAKKINIDIIDNGSFKGNLIALWDDIRNSATKARIMEGDSRTTSNLDNWNNAFDLWKEVFIKCQLLREEYYLSKKVAWARKKILIDRIKDWGIGAICAGAMKIVGNYLYDNWDLIKNILSGVF